MPLLELTTNTSIDDCQHIAQQASKLTAEILGKPESYVMVKIQPEQALIFAGTDEPAAHVKLKSLGLAEDSTGDFSEKICSFISSQFDINACAVYVQL